MHCSTPHRGLTFLTVAIIAFLGIGSVVLSSQGEDNTAPREPATKIAKETPKNNIVQQNVSGNAGVLEIDKSTYDFGEIPIYGGVASTTFTLKNSGTEPLVLKRVTTSCMCTKALIDGKTFGLHMNQTADITLSPREEKTMAVAFDPLAHGDNATGPVTRIISIETDSKTTPLLETKITGNVVKN